jgi:hypothetical protein
VRAVYAHLADQPAFPSLADFKAFVVEEIQPVANKLAQSGATEADFARVITDRLLQPVEEQSFEFVTPVSSAATPLPILGPLNNGQALELSNAEHDMLGEVVHLSGRVNALRWTGAVRAIEREIESLLGCAIVVGFAEYNARYGMNTPLPIDLEPRGHVETCLSPRVSHLVTSTDFSLTQHLILLLGGKERIRDSLGDALKAFRCTLLNPGDQGRRLRNACTFFLRGLACTHAGEAALHLTLCLESLLLDESRDEVGRRLKREVTACIGARNARPMERLYAARSGYVHRGRDAGTASVLPWRDMTRRVVENKVRELAGLPVVDEDDEWEENPSS